MAHTQNANQTCLRKCKSRSMAPVPLRHTLWDCLLEDRRDNLSIVV